VTAKNSDDKPYGFGNTNRRFPNPRRQKGAIAKDRFAFEQAMQGNDCKKMGRGGDFVVQQRDFFGAAHGEPTVVDVKVGGARFTEADKQRRRQLRGRYKTVRY
jgi:hypothetical protein